MMFLSIYKIHTIKRTINVICKRTFWGIKKKSSNNRDQPEKLALDLSFQFLFVRFIRLHECEHVWANEHTFELFPMHSCLSAHLSDRKKEAAVISLEGPQTLTLTCVTSACQCHQGASIFHTGIFLPMALHFTLLVSMLSPSPTSPVASSSRRLSLICHFFHQRPLYLLLPSCNSEGGKGTIGVKMVTTLSQLQA